MIDDYRYGDEEPRKLKLKQRLKELEKRVTEQWERFDEFFRDVGVEVQRVQSLGNAQRTLTGQVAEIEKRLGRLPVDPEKRAEWLGHQIRRIPAEKPVEVDPESFEGRLRRLEERDGVPVTITVEDSNMSVLAARLDALERAQGPNGNQTFQGVRIATYDPNPPDDEPHMTYAPPCDFVQGDEHCRLAAEHDGVHDGVHQTFKVAPAGPLWRPFCGFERSGAHCKLVAGHTGGHEMGRTL